MKCPKCGADSSVLRTTGAVRRRECFQGHRFNSQELSFEELGLARKAAIRLVRLRQLINEDMEAA